MVLHLFPQEAPPQHRGGGNVIASLLFPLTYVLY